jgi:hypothetical protein
VQVDAQKCDDVQVHFSFRLLRWFDFGYFVRSPCLVCAQRELDKAVAASSAKSNASSSHGPNDELDDSCFVMYG